MRSGAGNRGCKDHEDQKVHASFSGQGRLASGCGTIFNCPKEYSFLTASVPAAIPLYAKTFKVSSVRSLSSHRCKEQNMDREHVKGAADKVKGAIKDPAGKVTGDKKLQSEGKFDKAKGSAHNLAGDVKDAARDASKTADD